MPKLSGVEDQGSILLGWTVLVVRGLSGEFSIGLQSRISGAGFRVEGVAQVCSVWALASWGLMWGLGVFYGLVTWDLGFLYGLVSLYRGDVGLRWGVYRT